MTTVGEVFDELVNELTPMYEMREATNIVRILFQEKLKMSRVDLAMHQSSNLNDKDKKQIFQVAEKLLEGQPVQYVLGKVDFLNCTLRVNKNVLIPRPETEELAQWVISENNSPELYLLDVGTGSGCIAISMAKNIAESFVTAIDISQPALELARINAITNATNIDFQNFDILNEEIWKKLDEFDVIVSNPPYVCEKEKEKMHVNVLEHEPHNALFVPDNDPLLFYRKISDMALKRLCKGGRIYFEINEAYAKEVKELLEKKGFSEVMIRQDMNNKDRFVKATLK